MGIDDELDIEADKEICISHHMHLCYLAFGLVEHKFRHHNEDISTSKKWIRTFIWTGEKFMDKMMKGSATVHR